MKKMLLLLCLAMLSASLVFADIQTREVDVKVNGREYNDVWKMWSDSPVTVYVDSRGLTYIKCGSIFPTEGALDDKQREQMISLLNKGLEWADKSKKDEIEITKSLGDFYGQATMKLTFFSANKGNQTDIILTSYENEFTSNKVYLNQDAVQHLIKALEQVPQTLAEIREQERKAKALE